MEKKIPVWAVLLVALLGLVGVVLFASAVRHVYSGGQRLGRLTPAIMAVAEFPTLAKAAFDQAAGRSPLLIDNRFPGLDGFRKNGVVQDGAVKDDGYLLLSAAQRRDAQPTVRLIRISDQTVVHDWAPRLAELASNKDSTAGLFTRGGDTRTTGLRMAHAVLLPDGGLLFNSQDGMLFRIDRCSRIQWALDGAFHHSIEQSVDGTFWVPSVIKPPSFDTVSVPGYVDDALTQISPAGKILFQKSVSRILEENGYRALLLAVGPYEHDAIHLNDIQPAADTTQYWRTGDLLVSLRHRSTVFMYRPATNKIVWLQTGPWLNQHDPNFVGDSRISVFGNDVARAGDAQVLVAGHNNVYVYDFADGRTTAPYASVMKRSDVRTITSGLQTILPNGDVIVEEQNYGRILRLSPQNVVWEFAVKVDNDNLSSLNSRYLMRQQVEKMLPVLTPSTCS